MNEDSDKDHSEDECKRTDVDERGVVRTDDISFKPASDDRICNRDCDCSGDNYRKHEVEGNLPDEFLLRASEDNADGIVLLGGRAMLTA